jgi:hypothetical protein
MRKKFGFVSLLALALVSSLALLTRTETAQAGAHYVNPCLKSVLCNGLAEYFEMDEPTNTPRVGAFGTLLSEPIATNIGTRTGHGGAGTAVSLAGTTSSYLWKSYSSGPTGHYTIAMWLYVDSAGVNGQLQYPISWDHVLTNRRGPSIYLFNNAGSLGVYHQAFEQETGNFATVSKPISAAAWHLVVVGMTTYLAGGTNTPNVWVSVDNGARSTATFGYFTTGGGNQFRIGCRPINGPAGTCDSPFAGGIDNLAIWSRSLDATDISLLWNSGAGRAYPFVTE